MTRILLACLPLLAWIWLLFVSRRQWSRRDADEIRPDERVPLPVKRVMLAIALVALPAATVIVVWPFASCVGGGIDLGISRSGGECVGVTEGRYKFSSSFIGDDVGAATTRRLDRVQDLIREQNDIHGDSVKVAFLSPLDSPLSGPRAVDELEGAAAAQRWINEDGRGSPKITLLVAHMGVTEKQWEPVVRKLIDMKDDEVPLVAVVGLGLSLDETGHAAEQLAGVGIPMVATSLTATELNHGNQIKGFHQVSHTNEQQVEAMFQYLRASGTDLSNAIVVQSGDESDTYTRSYGDAILRRLEADGRNIPVRVFGDADNDPGKLANQFRSISETLCRNQDAVIFYAGRSRFVANFLQRLTEEPCLHSVRVLSGSDASVLRMMPGDPVAERNWGTNVLDKVFRNGKVSLLFTTQADPDLLAGRPQFTELATAFRDAGFNKNDLRTRWAIMSWDAMLVTAQWVWEGQRIADPELPHAEDVARTSTYKFADSKDPYYGASGRFWFDEKGKRAGDAPKVVKLTAGGSIRECSLPGASLPGDSLRAPGGGC